MRGLKWQTFISLHKRGLFLKETYLYSRGDEIPPGALFSLNTSLARHHSTLSRKNSTTRNKAALLTAKAAHSAKKTSCRSTARGENSTPVKQTEQLSLQICWKQNKLQPIVQYISQQTQHISLAQTITFQQKQHYSRKNSINRSDSPTERRKTGRRMTERRMTERRRRDAE
jgi:hypothetical protein